MCNCSKRYNTRTKAFTLTDNQTIDFNKIGNVVGYSFKNIGATNAKIWGWFEINVGDPMIQFVGNDNEFKADLIPLTFTGGTGKIALIVTQFEGYVK